ncbi:SMP-30/gluconolaconase/LRE-like protein [Kribbella sp. VKM Ac-2569]|uniref:SMP-30/gluconolactonase/LRE family protein n=1 Tax=Kribbella sp. VKM Ac-2569 TaxID=2512220 RepID=UPI00102C9443|nr:SMP-30/gluconolactonase/LRE family protein [Kribbella sp. VKM Ac-2569]RZT13363.1 SMP-30/gluconolaconase/LRE-like protein [Kribbella sp. VKM Ac-2569]
MRFRAPTAALLTMTVALPAAGITTASAATATATATTATTAAAAATSIPAALRRVAQFDGRTSDRYPEGIAWDPSRRAFLIGSMATGRISVVGRDGVPHPFGIAPGVSTFGLHVDAVRNRVLVTYADIGNGERSSEATTYKQSGIAIYNLRTGQLEQRVDLNTPRLNPAGGHHGANDLAIDAAGNAYVTDPASDAIYKVTPAGVATVLIRDERLRSDTIGANGIVWHPAGYLLTVRYDTGTLFRISPRGELSVTGLTSALVGGDGLALRPDGRLIAITNKLGAPGVEQATVLSSRDNYRTAQVRSVEPWLVAGPTTAAVTPYGTYVLSGRIDVLLAGGWSDQFTIRRMSR